MDVVVDPLVLVVDDDRERLTRRGGEAVHLPVEVVRHDRDLAVDRGRAVGGIGRAAALVVVAARGGEQQERDGEEHGGGRNDPTVVARPPGRACTAMYRERGVKTEKNHV